METGSAAFPEVGAWCAKDFNDALINLLASRELVKQMEEQFEGHQFVFRETRNSSLGRSLLWKIS